jgi:hypothetical protein
VLALAVQFVIVNRAHDSLLPALAMIVGFAVGGLLLLALLERAVPRARAAVKSRRNRRRDLRAAAGSETRCRAQMDELCPDGWQAQITVFSSARDLPSEAPNPERNRVALDWAPLSPGAFPEPMHERRVWAETVRLALEAMVADRMTDEMMQQIERQAMADGAEWPDQ